MSPCESDALSEFLCKRLDMELWFNVHRLHDGYDAVRTHLQVCTYADSVSFPWSLRLRPGLDDLDTVQEKGLLAAYKVVCDSEPDDRLSESGIYVSDDGSSDDQVIL